jgi:hypothetical protein
MKIYSPQIIGDTSLTGSLSVSGSVTLGVGGIYYNAINIQNRGYTNTITTDANSVGNIAIGGGNTTGKGAAIIVGSNNIDTDYANGQDNAAIGWNNTFGGGNFTSYNFQIGKGNNVSGDGSYRIVLGGNNNSSSLGSYNAILAGKNNIVSHDYSAVIGGQDISTAAANTVYVPNLHVSGSQIISGSLRGDVGVLSIASNTASLDCSTGNFFTITLVSGSTTHLNPTNIQPGQTINLLVNTTGSGLLTFAPSVIQVTGSAYTATTGSGNIGKDIITFISFDSTSLYLSNIKNFI